MAGGFQRSCCCKDENDSELCVQCPEVEIDDSLDCPATADDIKRVVVTLAGLTCCDDAGIPQHVFDLRGAHGCGKNYVCSFDGTYSFDENDRSFVAGVEAHFFKVFTGVFFTWDYMPTVFDDLTGRHCDETFDDEMVGPIGPNFEYESFRLIEFDISVVVEIVDANEPLAEDCLRVTVNSNIRRVAEYAPGEPSAGVRIEGGNIFDVFGFEIFRTGTAVKPGVSIPNFWVDCAYLRQDFDGLDGHVSNRPQRMTIDGTATAHVNAIPPRDPQEDEFECPATMDVTLTGFNGSECATCQDQGGGTWRNYTAIDVDGTYTVTRTSVARPANGECTYETNFKAGLTTVTFEEHTTSACSDVSPPTVNLEGLHIEFTVSAQEFGGAMFACVNSVTITDNDPGAKVAKLFLRQGIGFSTEPMVRFFKEMANELDCDDAEVATNDGTVNIGCLV